MTGSGFDTISFGTLTEKIKSNSFLEIDMKNLCKWHYLLIVTWSTNFHSCKKVTNWFSSIFLPPFILNELNYYGENWKYGETGVL